jgi:hypothetical protein
MTDPVDRVVDRLVLEVASRSGMPPGPDAVAALAAHLRQEAHAYAREHGAAAATEALEAAGRIYLSLADEETNP